MSASVLMTVRKSRPLFELKSPGTFSARSQRGLRASAIRANSKNRELSLPAKPSRFPATETSWPNAGKSVADDATAIMTASSQLIRVRGTIRVLVILDDSKLYYPDDIVTRAAGRGGRPSQTPREEIHVSLIFFVFTSPPG